MGSGIFQLQMGAAMLLSLALALVGCGRSEPPPVGTVDLGGRGLFYEMRGAGCPVVLIGGGSAMDSRQWSELMDALSERFRLVRYDPAAIGESDVPQAAFSEEEDLLGLLDGLGIRRPVLVGNSSAGGLALEFAVTYPDRVRAVVAISPFVPGWEMSPEMQERVGRFGNAISAGVDAFLQVALTDPHFIPAPRNPRARTEAAALVRSGFEKMTSIDPAMVRMPSTPLIERLPELKVPALLLVGNLDHPDLHRRIYRLDRLIPVSRALVIPDSGHTPTLENPRTLAEILGSFLDRIGWLAEACSAR